MSSNVAPVTGGYEAYEAAGELLRALSAPIRVAIVAELGAGERCVHELVEKWGRPSRWSRSTFGFCAAPAWCAVRAGGGRSHTHSWTNTSHTSSPTP